MSMMNAMIKKATVVAALATPVVTSALRLQMQTDEPKVKKVWHCKANVKLAPRSMKSFNSDYHSAQEACRGEEDQNKCKELKGTGQYADTKVCVWAKVPDVPSLDDDVDGKRTNYDKLQKEQDARNDELIKNHIKELEEGKKAEAKVPVDYGTQKSPQASESASKGGQCIVNPLAKFPPKNLKENDLDRIHASWSCKEIENEKDCSRHVFTRKSGEEIKNACQWEGKSKVLVIDMEKSWVFAWSVLALVWLCVACLCLLVLYIKKSIKKQHLNSDDFLFAALLAAGCVALVALNNAKHFTFIPCGKKQ